MHNEIHYSSCWEDEDMVKKTIKPGDRALMIVSGGCSLFTGILQDPARLVGVDMNPAQVALVKLKIAALENLKFTEALKFLGLGTQIDHPEELRKTYEELKIYLSPKERQYFNDYKWERGLFSMGSFENYIDFFRRFLLPLFLPEHRREEFLACRTIEEQEAMYNKKINNWIYRLLFKMYFGTYWMTRRGRHPDLMKHIKEDPSGAFRQRMERAWKEIPIKRNPYMQRILTGFIPDNCLPSWASRENSDKMRELLKRIELISLKFEDYVRVAQNSWEYFYLSDICEAMTDEKAQELFDLCAYNSKKGARMVLMNNLVHRRPRKDGYWHLNAELSQELWNTRKTSFYGFIGVYERQ